MFVIAADRRTASPTTGANYAQGILGFDCLDDVTIAHNNAVSYKRLRAMVMGLEHAATVRQASGFSSARRPQLPVDQCRHNRARCRSISTSTRAAARCTTARRCRRGTSARLDSRIPIVPTPDDIHLFVAGGAAGAFRRSSPAGAA